jgi:hypothetical protein
MLLCITKNILQFFDGSALVLPSRGITILTFKDQVERHSQRDALLSVLRTLLLNPAVIVFLLEPRHLLPDTKQGQERVGDGQNLVKMA